MSVQIKVLLCVIYLKNVSRNVKKQIILYGLTENNMLGVFKKSIHLININVVYTMKVIRFARVWILIYVHN